MPALSYRHVRLNAPKFNYHTTPSNVGIIPETFRLTSGVVRSLHPSHSVCAWGRLAEDLTKEHELDETPVGRRSPFHRIKDVEGSQLLFLGCGSRPNTSMHGVEEVVGSTFLSGADTAWSGVTRDGSTFNGRYRRHEFLGWEQRYERLEQLMPPEAIKHGKVLAANAVVFDVNTMWQVAEKALRADPYALVAPQAGINKHATALYRLWVDSSWAVKDWLQP
mmetsp:Transcript_44134/g.95737  ORF Transcript_44134/g.95737 Transcript_44134/m.95737 type:complete len:221 (-) Transcript_44134:130-792(-)